MVNLYGPTECTTISTWIGPLAGDVTPPIGRVRLNMVLYVLDPWMRPVPVGVAGELYIAGDGLARGYHGRPSLTAQRFVADPFGDPGHRMYRSGDIVRWRSDGQLEFVGRVDHQVKFRGFRIELGEIEQVLGAYPGVESATVLVREDSPGTQRLVGYLLVRDPSIVDVSQIQASAARVLPSYMTPSALIALTELPMSPNGKIERAALPAPPGTDFGGVVLPDDASLEARVTAIWAEVLGLAVVAPDANFFDLGGHSLIAVKVVNRIREIIDIEVSVRLLFEYPSVASLTRQLKKLCDN
jgi:acyl-coenzyme A synthetase/AMP-(fatty) acid ligase/acyl carrier protein